MQNLQVMPYNSLKLDFLLHIQSFPCPTGTVEETFVTRRIIYVQLNSQDIISN